MGRLARVVVAGMPHHVTQRGNRRQPTFFCEEDYAAYIELMAGHCRDEGVAVWAYCLVPNHVHLIAVPETKQGLRRAIGEAHGRCTRRINFRENGRGYFENGRGYLWQGRSASFVMDEPYLLAAARYVGLNPVRAKLVAWAADWRYSSARAHLAGRDDRLVHVAPLLAMADDWQALLESAMPEQELRKLRDHTRTGRPMGDSSSVERLETLLGRVLRPPKPGRRSRFSKLPK
jgi:putative transposase